MAKRLAGKTAFITAAGQGIGRAIAEQFILEGAKVFASDLDVEKLATLERARKIKLNVLNTRSVEAIAKRVGAVDILVNAAGFVHNGTVLTTSEQDWDFSFDLNVKSMHRTIAAFLPSMLEKGGGSIINIASIVSMRGLPNRYVYGATKAAVIGLTKAVAADYIKQGVRCNAICPGTVQSPSLDERIGEMSSRLKLEEEAVRQSFIDRQPMGRLGTALEIAHMAVYLASDEASFTTGQAMSVDGGFTM